jgi:hypothetical protein
MLGNRVRAAIHICWTNALSDGPWIAMNRPDHPTPGIPDSPAIDQIQLWLSQLEPQPRLA